MNLFFADPKTYQRMHEGPLGQYIDSYVTEMCEQGYCQAATESQTRLVSDLSRWMAERKITPQQLTTDQCKIYLRSRAQHRRPKRDDWAALTRFLNLLLRREVIPEPSPPTATPVTQLQVEYGQYLRQERALVSSTVHRYVVLAREFLTDCFGTSPIDLSTLQATNITGFVQRRAATFKRINRTSAEHRAEFRPLAKTPVRLITSVYQNLTAKFVTFRITSGWPTNRQLAKTS